MSLTANATVQPVLGHTDGYPVLASTHIYQGKMLGKSSGYARQLVAGDEFLGHAFSEADNSSGANAAIDVDRLHGRYRLIALVTGASAVTDEGSLVYASDAETLTLTKSTNSLVGKIYRWLSSTKCVVEFDTDAARLALIASGAGVLTVTDDILLAHGKAVKSDTTTAHTIALQGYDVDGSTRTNNVLITNGNDVQLTLAASGGINVSNDVLLANGKAIKSDTTTAHTIALQGYDVDGSTRPNNVLITNGNDVQLTLAASGGINVSDDVLLANGKAIKSDTTTAHTIALQGYDVDGSTRANMVLITNGNAPTLQLSNAAANAVGLFGATPATQRAHVADVATNLATNSTTSWQTIAVAINGLAADIEAIGIRATA